MKDRKRSKGRGKGWENKGGREREGMHTLDRTC